jgi:5-methylthioadenosine/S-adenosylhomocysteine deaminase
MKTLFTNAKILTLRDNEDVFAGELVVEDDHIAYVGPKAPAGQYEKTIDCEGNLLLPGFKNAHTHSAMSFARSLADDLPLHDWLFDKIFPLEAKIAPEDQYRLSKVSILEYLTSGMTACFDMYYNPEEMARASEEMGFRTVLLGTVTKYRESVEEMKRSYLNINGKSPLVSYRLGYHAEYTCTEEILKALSVAAHELKCPIFTHICETSSEVEECRKRHNGMSPVEYMESLGLLDYGGGGFHCVHFGDRDIQIFKKHNASVVSCPGSNSKLASGIAPLTRFVKAGLNLGLGTDGPASDNGLDMFYEMRLACVLQKLLNKDAASFDALLALKAATVGSAMAMGLNDSLYLSKGQQADIVMIDLMKPNMRPLNNISKNLVYSGAKDDVKMTMVAGKILYMDGKFFVGEDVSAIYEKAQEITNRLKAD